MVGLTLAAQMPSARPRLVVGIVVDGLREDYIDLLKGYFGPDGFRRLMRDGVMIDNVDFGTYVDPTAATAIIYSGASSSINGIPATFVYDEAGRREHSIVLDPDKIGNYTDETYSPKSIRVSTLSDEVRIDGGGIGNVYSIAPQAAQSIVLAGHAANSAFWINDVSGRWATTTYYKDVPQPIQARNFTKPLATRLDTLAWRPLMKPEEYPDLPAYKKYYPFRHLFQRNDVDRFRSFKTSAPVNTEVTDLAAEYITGLKLGTHSAIDMLNLSYTVAPFGKAKDSDSRLETMDTYLRLDSDLSRLFKVIDNAVGLNNAFVFLTGTPAAPSEKRDDERWGIPNGEFSARRAMSLLNVYLMAQHGNGEWVSGYHNRHLFLNKELIKQRDLDIRKVREDAAAFLIRMSGVSGAWTIDDVVAGKAGNNAAALKRNIVADYAGDVIIDINPGWEIVSVNPTTQKEERTTVRTGLISAPAFILSPYLVPDCIDVPVDARAIAPTVARLLRIRSPNAVELPALTLKRKQ
jgi:hypothetical protein